ncbi:hypothetical protein HMPREF9554_00874, partial [Treponema phagedenis F0421]
IGVKLSQIKDSVPFGNLCSGNICFSDTKDIRSFSLYRFRTKTSAFMEK